MKGLAPFALLALAAGCARIDLGSAARRDAADAIRCPEAALEMQQVGEYRYRGVGCGEEVIVACTAADLEPTCYPERAGAEDPGGDGVTPAQADVERMVRAGLDARRDDVLACVGRPRVGVRVAYGERGDVDFTLQGELSGSPEEACVRDVLSGVRVAATGAEGLIIHLVD